MFLQNSLARMTRRLWPAIIAFGLLSGGVAGAQDVSTDGSLVRMGVRVDAKPFAWQDPASGSFLGFLVDLCTDAATRAGYPFEQVPITAVERIEVLKGARPDIDVLCDPTTITLGRMRAFAALEPPGSVAFSPIVFVANGTYMTRTDRKGASETPEDPVACLAPPASSVADASAATPAAGAAVEAAPLKYLRAGYVVGTTIGPVIASAIRAKGLLLAPNERVCPVEMPDHVTGVAAFCGGDLDYYFGDADIIEAYVADARSQGLPCEVEARPRPISYEPYALVIGGRKPEFRDAFVTALYEVFHHGTADDRFEGHFEGRRMAPFLETLFRINRIPAGVAPVTADGPEAGEGGDMVDLDAEVSPTLSGMVPDKEEVFTED